MIVTSDAYARTGFVAITTVLVPALAIGSQSFKTLRGGFNQFCAIDQAGAIWCWGDNAVGQCGLPPPTACQDVVKCPGDVTEPHKIGS